MFARVSRKCRVAVSLQFFVDIFHFEMVFPTNILLKWSGTVSPQAKLIGYLFSLPLPLPSLSRFSDYPGSESVALNRFSRINFPNRFFFSTLPPFTHRFSTSPIILTPKNFNTSSTQSIHLLFVFGKTPPLYKPHGIFIPSIIYRFAIFR